MLESSRLTECRVCGAGGYRRLCDPSIHEAYADYWAKESMVDTITPVLSAVG